MTEETQFKNPQLNTLHNEYAALRKRQPGPPKEVAGWMESVNNLLSELDGRANRASEEARQVRRCKNCQNWELDGSFSELPGWGDCGFSGSTAGNMDEPGQLFMALDGETRGAIASTSPEFYCICFKPMEGEK